MRIGIIGAMEAEVAHLVERLEGHRETARAGMRFHEGMLDGRSVVVVECGVGKVNAALCVQMLADLYDVTHVVNTGVAGSLDARINIGDFVVSTEALYHDVDVCNLGYEPGQVPGMQRLFPADKDLRREALAAIAAAAPDQQAFEGRIVSGDQFIRDDDVKQRLASQFGGLCSEMEGTAIAHACTLNGIAFVIIRAISDKADGSDSVLYPVFEVKAAKHCAQITEYLVSHLPQPEGE